MSRIIKSSYMPIDLDISEVTSIVEVGLKIRIRALAE